MSSIHEEVKKLKEVLSTVCQSKVELRKQAEIDERMAKVASREIQGPQVEVMTTSSSSTDELEG